MSTPTGSQRRVPRCVENLREQETYFLRQWEAARRDERNPRQYADDMRDAGRSHLLREDER